MDIIGIIHRGIKIIRNKENLTSFFIREYSKAERDSFYTVDDFFDPLFQKIELLKNKLEKDFVDYKKRLEFKMERASRNELEFWDAYYRKLLDKKGVKYIDFKEEQNKLLLLDAKKKLADFDIGKAQTRLLYEVITYTEINLLEGGIQEARKSVAFSFNDKAEKRSATTTEKRAKRLNTIWLAEAKISVDEFIQKGIEKGLWNEHLQLITQKGKSPYGSGKTLLANIYIALKGYSIHTHINYNRAGEIFCQVFGIENKKTTKEPYKVFSSANSKGIQEIKRAFKIR